ncbi:hypothetical protein P171DRAFT_490647 [Karstenula rhodostoma CBS 690.94]|uniref:Uncharacterized protein n=1 Tax=Karstenula rhodostoma CBS 690.94 TaxID=1392251 RepID=A0A9P4P9B1_9PLEO|nr:hypothetical protein P171DRAFT_490647 [Karstenula rhodostoma CBS 690.94]
MSISLFAIVRLFPTLLDFSLRQFSIAAAEFLGKPETKKVVRAVIQDCLGRSSTLRKDPEFLKAIAELPDFNHCHGSSTLEEIKRSIKSTWKMTPSFIFFNSEGNMRQLSPWKCSRCNTILHIDWTGKAGSLQGSDKPCPFCPDHMVPT